MLNRLRWLLLIRRPSGANWVSLIVTFKFPVVNRHFLSLCLFLCLFVFLWGRWWSDGAFRGRSRHYSQSVPRMLKDTLTRILFKGASSSPQRACWAPSLDKGELKAVLSTSAERLLPQSSTVLYYVLCSSPRGLRYPGVYIPTSSLKLIRLFWWV